MRALILFVAGLGAVALGNYWFNPYAPVCRLPVSYTIGTFDERFGLSREEALASLKEAEDVWEEPFGQTDIFQYKEEGPFRINFIYDERQRQAEAALDAKENLAVRGDANEVLGELHQKLIAEYEGHKAEYDAKLSKYERDLESYNSEVEYYNRQGGAPSEAFEKLERDRRALDADRRELSQMRDQLEDLAEQINSVGDKGNELIGEYNELVEDFNDTFAHGHEYTQGDYRAREINIYTFTNKEELVLVLAHEFGHALSLPHVQNSASIMYYLLDEQLLPPTLTKEDQEAYASLCKLGFFGGLRAATLGVYNNLVNK